MKTHIFALILLFGISICGCSDTSDNPTAADIDSLFEQYAATSKDGPLADFVGKISDGNYDQAFAILHPKLAATWTKERFAQDWVDVKSLLPSGFAPNATGSFSGNSAQGPYLQATYRLEASWRSTTSLKLTSAQVDGKDVVTRIDIRMPSSKALPEDTVSHADSFTKAMLTNGYETVNDLFSEAAKQQYTPKFLEGLRPFFGESKESTVQSYNRLLANSVWYDVVLFNRPDSPAEHLELIMQSNAGKTEIVSLTFKGRLRMAPE